MAGVTVTMNADPLFHDRNLSKVALWRFKGAAAGDASGASVIFVLKTPLYASLIRKEDFPQGVHLDLVRIGFTTTEPSASQNVIGYATSGGLEDYPEGIIAMGLQPVGSPTIVYQGLNQVLSMSERWPYYLGKLSEASFLADKEIMRLEYPKNANAKIYNLMVLMGVWRELPLYVKS